MFDDEQQGEELVHAITTGTETYEPPPVEPTHDTSIGGLLDKPLEQPQATTAHPLIDQQPSDSVLDPPAASSSPVEIRQISSSRATGSWRRRTGGVRDLDLQQEGGGVEDASGGGSRSGSSSGGEGGHEGPMTPMNDAGPFVFDGGSFLGLEGSESEDMMIDGGVGVGVGVGVGDEMRVEPRGLM